MKKIAIIIIALTAFASASAQNPLPVNAAQLNAGVGFSSWGIPIYFGFDYGVDKDFTIGAEVSYRSYNEKWGHKDWDFSVTGFSGNFNYHFSNAMKIKKKWDLYAGINIGFFVWSNPSGYDGDRTSGLGLGAQIGARYYLSNTVGLNLELGGGNAFSGGKFGVTIRM